MVIRMCVSGADKVTLDAFDFLHLRYHLQDDVTPMVSTFIGMAIIIDRPKTILRCNCLLYAVLCLDRKYHATILMYDTSKYMAPIS